MGRLDGRRSVRSSRLGASRLVTSPSGHRSLLTEALGDEGGHAQFLFPMEQGEWVLKAIARFLRALW
jgi:hypothetical protein